MGRLRLPCQRCGGPKSSGPGRKCCDSCLSLPPPAAPCAIPGCDKPAHGKGWCRMHYTRWLRHGDPLIAAGAGVPRVEDPKYFTKHMRVKRIRGSASQHLCSGCCGSRASHWATIYGRDGLDVFGDYVPLCARCHSQYDWSWRRVS